MSCVLSVVSVVCVVLLRVFRRDVVLDFGELLGAVRFWILRDVEGIVNLLNFEDVLESLKFQGVGSLCTLRGLESLNFEGVGGL